MMSAYVWVPLALMPVVIVATFVFVWLIRRQKE